MTWQKIARVAVACIGLGTAIAVAVLTRERPAVNRSAATASGDPEARFQSGAGVDVRHEGSRRVAQAEYAQVRRYDDRLEWDDFKLTLDDGATLSARRVSGRFAGDNREEPSTFAFEGGVRFQATDGATLEGESGTYDSASGMASIPGAASISRGRMSGRGTGGTYERSTGAFKLLADAHMVMTPEAEGDPVEASASSITVVGGGSAILLEDRAQIGRSSETMRADRATIYLAEDQQVFRTVELRGHSKVTPVAGKASDIPDLQADDIELEFYEGGAALRRAALHRQATMLQLGDQGRRSIAASEIAFRTAADGKTLTRLDASERVSVTLPASAGVAARTITGAQLAASGTDRAGLTSAAFEGGVEFVEIVPGVAGATASRRSGRSQRLVLEVKGQLDAIESARFERDVRFTSGDVVGTADFGDYRATKGELELRPGPQGPPRRARVEDGDVIVEAAEGILVDLNTNDLHARRGVTTVSRPRRGGGATGGTAMFDSSQPLYGTGVEFWYESNAERFRYRGDEKTRAQLKQSDDSLVLGNEIVFLQTSQDLTATGAAESTFMATAGAAQAPTRYRATAAAFHYDDVNRTVEYQGAPAVLRMGEDETLAEQIVLTLASAAQTLEQMEATGSVRASLQEGRQALGERLIYDAGTGGYRLWGKPLTLWTRDADGTCSSQSGNFVKFEGDVGAPDFPKTENPAGATLSSKLACPPFLVVKK